MSHLDFEIVSDFELRISSLSYINSTNSYVRIYKPFMQNKPNFRNDKMSANLFTTRVYEENGHSGHQKTKPIQTQFNPIQSQFNPKQSQFKPNQSQFFQSQTGQIPKQIIWSHNVSGPFEYLSGQYLHIMDSLLILLVGENTSQLFLKGELFFRKKGILAHYFRGR